MSQIATTYAEALYGLAKDAAITGQILEELAMVSEIWKENPDYIRLLKAPSLSKQERCGLLDQGFRGRVHQYLLNFLKILCEKGYISQLEGCYQAYRRQYNEDNGVLEVCAVTAVELSVVLQENLKRKLEKTTGKQIDLRCRVDARVLGGIRLEMEGRQLDGTIRRRLDELQSALHTTVI